MTVYVIQEPRSHFDPNTGRRRVKNLSSAGDYGILKFVLSAEDEPCNTPGPCLQKLRKVLRDFDPEHDYLLYAGGDPYAPLLAGVALAEANLREATFLRWDRGVGGASGVYTPVRMKIR